MFTRCIGRIMGPRPCGWSLSAPNVAFHAGGGEQQIFRVAGSASVTGSGSATVTLVHTHATEPAEVVVRLKGGKARGVQHIALGHERLNAHNTFAQPETVMARQVGTAPQASGEAIRCVLPPASVNRLDIQLG